MSGQDGPSDDSGSMDNGSNGLGNHMRSGDHRGSSNDLRGDDRT